LAILSNAKPVLASIQTFSQIGDGKVVMIVPPEETEPYFSIRLYPFRRQLVRRYLPSLKWFLA
jgi:hypothetical protein